MTDHHDMAEFAAATSKDNEPWHHPHFRVSEGGLRVDTHRPLPVVSDCRWPQAAEAATEVGQDDEDEPRVSGALAWPVYVVLSVLAVMAAWHFSGVLARFFVGLLA